MRGGIGACCLLALALLAQAGAQVPVSHDGNLALEFKHIGRNADSWFVDYVDYGREPALRFEVHHYHAWCYGYLYLTETHLAYEPAFTPAQKDGFSVSLQQVKSVTPRFSGINFGMEGKTQRFAFISEPSSPQLPREQMDGRDQLLTFLELAVANFDAARSQMARVLAGSQKTFTKDTALPNAPEVVNSSINVLVPADASEGALVDAATANLRILGFAIQPSAIRGVWVNSKPALMRPITRNVVEFESTHVPFTGDVTPMRLTVKSDTAQSQMEFGVNRPRVQFAMLPLETHDATYTVRGKLIGYGKVAGVRLQGIRGTIQKKADGTTTFEIPQVPMDVGKNVVSGTIYTDSGGHEPFQVTINRYPRLDLGFIQHAIHTLSRGRLLELIGEYGVDFPLDDANEKALRAAGADDGLLLAISKVEHSPPSPSEPNF